MKALGETRWEEFLVKCGIWIQYKSEGLDLDKSMINGMIKVEIRGEC